MTGRQTDKKTDGQLESQIDRQTDRKKGNQDKIMKEDGETASPSVSQAEKIRSRLKERQKIKKVEERKTGR